MNRKQQRLFRFAVDLFIDLLRQTTGNKVNYKCNDQDTACFEAFLNEYGESVGENFIREFSEYGIHSWFNSGSERDYTHAIRFNWLFSKAAIKRWDALPGHARTRIVRTNLKRSVKINTVKRETALPELLLTVRKSEENIKKEFYGTQRGLLWCIANTTLYFHKSGFCAACVFKDDCKETLKREYPKVYKLRGYGE